MTARPEGPMGPDEQRASERALLIEALWQACEEVHYLAARASSERLDALAARTTDRRESFWKRKYFWVYFLIVSSGVNSLNASAALFAGFVRPAIASVGVAVSSILLAIWFEYTL